MMNRIFRISAYIFVPVLLGFLTRLSNNVFFEQFTQNSIVLLVTLLAINVTANALIVSELSKLKAKYPNADIGSTSRELKRTLITQIGLILFLFVTLIVKDFFFIFPNWEFHLQTLVNALVIGVFIYFLEVIYDQGRALFKIIDFNSNPK